jgi:hypothetical protein
MEICIHTWKDNIEKTRKKILYKFNTTSKHKGNGMLYNQKLKNIQKCTKHVNAKIFYWMTQWLIQKNL